MLTVCLLWFIDCLWLISFTQKYRRGDGVLTGVHGGESRALFFGVAAAVWGLPRCLFGAQKPQAGRGHGLIGPGGACAFSALMLSPFGVFGDPTAAIAPALSYLAGSWFSVGTEMCVGLIPT